MIPEEIDDDVNIPHYLGYILDNEKKEIWLLDSLTDNVLTEKKTGFLKFAKALYPTIYPISFLFCVCIWDTNFLQQ